MAGVGFGGSAKRLGSAEGPASMASWERLLAGLTGVRREAAGGACAFEGSGEREATGEDETAAIFCAETYPTAATPSINRTATMPTMRHIRISRACFDLTREDSLALPKADSDQSI